MRRADRLFELIQVLRRARKAVTAAQLAEKLEVAPRTIYRDIAALMAMRVPIDGAAGVGYVMRPGYDLPPLMFDREEVEAIAVGLQLLGRTGDRGLLAAGRRAGAKIAGVLPERREGELDDDRFVVSDFGAPAASYMGVLRCAIPGASPKAAPQACARRPQEAGRTRQQKAGGAAVAVHFQLVANPGEAGRVVDAGKQRGQPLPRPCVEAPRRQANQQRLFSLGATLGATLKDLTQSGWFAERLPAAVRFTG